MRSWAGFAKALFPLNMLGLARGFDANEILPGLWLGSVAASADRQGLREREIVGVVNVSADIPNMFERGGGIRYLHIPVQDWETEQLLPFLEACCDFIDGVLEGNDGQSKVNRYFFVYQVLRSSLPELSFFSCIYDVCASLPLSLLCVCISHMFLCSHVWR